MLHDGLALDRTGVYEGLKMVSGSHNVLPSTPDHALTTQTTLHANTLSPKTLNPFDLSTPQTLNAKPKRPPRSPSGLP